MKNLIERYIYDVVRRLPEDERGDVENELRANIYDMLPEKPTDAEIEAVLLELGYPGTLAESYRQKPRYLISPAMYGFYIRTLKLVLPLVGVLVMIVVSLLEIVSVLSGGTTTAPELISSVFARGISGGFEAALQALFWITLGFTIAEHTSLRDSIDKEWKLKDLPDEIVDSMSAIPLSESIIELICTVVFSAIAIAFCLGAFKINALVIRGDIRVDVLFSQEFLAASVAPMAIGAVLGSANAIMRIIHRRRNWQVCIASLADYIGCAGMGIYLLLSHRPFSAELLRLIETLGGDNLKLFSGSESGGASPLALIFCAIIAIATASAAFFTIRKTLKAVK